MKRLLHKAGRKIDRAFDVITFFIAVIGFLGLLTAVCSPLFYGLTRMISGVELRIEETIAVGFAAALVMAAKMTIRRKRY